MDGDDHRAQQYGQPYQSPSASRPPAHQVTPMSEQRYSQALQSPTESVISRSSVGRPVGPAYAYGYPGQQYGQQPIQGVQLQGIEMQYQPGQMQDERRQPLPMQPPQLPYQPYGQNVIMQGQPQAVYGTVAQFPQRQSTAAEVLSSHFGVPQYYQHPETAHPGISAGPSAYAAPQVEQGPYQQPLAPARPSGSSAYINVQPEPGLLQPRQSVPIQPEMPQDDFDKQIKQHQEQVRRIFEAIRAGRLQQAGEQLMVVSRLLLESVIVLGLHHDKAEQNELRLELWRNFNLCWEALGQRQREVTEEALRNRQTPTDFLSAEKIRAMIDQLVKLCDQIEQHGLVDYDMGVWEEQIVHIFTKCLDLLTSEDSSQPQSTQGARSDAPHKR